MSRSSITLYPMLIICYILKARNVRTVEEAEGNVDLRKK